MTTVLIFTILLALSAFFSSAETAYFSLTQSKMYLMRRKKQRFAHLVYRLKKDPQRLLTTILIGNNIVNLFTASLATVVAARFFDSAIVGIATGVSTVLILLFGEIIPKSFAYARNGRIARFAAPVLIGVEWALFPIIEIFDALGRFFRKICRIDSTARITEEDIRMTTRLGVEQGGIDYREHEMIENIFRFDDTPVDDIMTPWYKVVVLNGTVPIEQIAHFTAHEDYSRYPVHDGKDDDRVIGYIHVKDILKILNSDRRDEPVRNFVSPVIRVDEDTAVERIFRQMKQERAHLMLVHKKDDPQTLVGVVTLENLVEEIVGEIKDETDRRDDH